MRIVSETPSSRAIFCKAWEKYFNINAIWITFGMLLEPFERTTFLRFESQLKSSNCLFLLLLAGQAQNTFKILHFWLQFCK